MSGENPPKRPCSGASDPNPYDKYAHIVDASSNPLDKEKSDLSYEAPTKQLSVPKPLAEPSFLNLVPHDELIRFISDFLFHNCVTESLKYVEVRNSY